MFDVEIVLLTPLLATLKGPYCLLVSVKVGLLLFLLGVGLAVEWALGSLEW